MYSIKIDDREDKTKDGFVPLFHAHNTNKKINVSVEMCRLCTGDFGVYYNGILVIVIERKTWNDLAGSIRNNRLDCQIKNMINLPDPNWKTKTYTKNKNPNVIHNTPMKLMKIILVEGVKRSKHGRLPIKNLEAKLDFIRIIHGFSVIFTQNKIQTTKRIFQLVENYHSCFTKYYVEHDIQGGTHEDKKTAKNKEDNDDKTENSNRDNKTEKNDENNKDNDKKDKKSNKKDKDLKQDPLKIKKVTPIHQHVLSCLCSLTGVSINTADIIISKWSIQELNKINETELSECKYQTGSMIGKSASKILKQFKNKNMKETYIKILSKIPGVTKKTASVILENLDVSTLLELDEQKISEIQKTPKRKIGKAVAKKIVDIFKYKADMYIKY